LKSFVLFHDYDNSENGDNNDVYVGGNGDENEALQDSTANENECPFCFCSPCVTSNRQLWLGDPVPPHARNSPLRKAKYKKF